MLKYILIDVDDTLLDFGECAKFSMKNGFFDFGFEFEDGMFDLFTEINNALWHKVERGEIPKDTLFGTRWFTIFEKLGLKGDGNLFEDRFQYYLNISDVTVPGADDALKYLSGKYKIFVASNAPSGQQEKRLSVAGLSDYVSGYFVSGDFGVSKPSKEFFTKCLESIPASPQECIMVGDSLTSDIAGAISAGIKTCWFNHGSHSLPGDVSVDYEFSSLSELSKIL